MNFGIFTLNLAMDITLNKIITQGVSVQPFLALSRAHRTSDFYLERTPHARVWFIVIFAAHHTHTYNFCKSLDGHQFKSKLVL